MTADAGPGKRGLWGRWAALLAERETGTSLALFRIACGTCLLYAIGSVVLHGMVPVIWLGPADGGLGPGGEGPLLFRLLGGVHPGTLWVVVTATLALGALLALGVGGRLTALLALQGYLALTGLNGNAAGAYDWLLTNALWLLVLGRATATLSLDCRLRTGRWVSVVPVSVWPRYLAIYQIVLVYWSTGMHKVSRSWTPADGFSALYYILQEPTWQRWDMSWLAHVYPLTQCATALDLVLGVIRSVITSRALVSPHTRAAGPVAGPVQSPAPARALDHRRRGDAPGHPGVHGRRAVLTGGLGLLSLPLSPAGMATGGGAVARDVSRALQAGRLMGAGQVTSSSGAAGACWCGLQRVSSPRRGPGAPGSHHPGRLLRATGQPLRQQARPGR